MWRCNVTRSDEGGVTIFGHPAAVLSTGLSGHRSVSLLRQVDNLSYVNLSLSTIHRGDQCG